MPATRNWSTRVEKPNRRSAPFRDALAINSCITAYSSTTFSCRRLWAELSLRKKSTGRMPDDAGVDTVFFIVLGSKKTWHPVANTGGELSVAIGDARRHPACPDQLLRRSAAEEA